MESEDTFLEVSFMGFPESCHCRNAGSRSKACRVPASQTQGSKRFAQDLQLEVEPTLIIAAD